MPGLLAAAAAAFRIRVGRRNRKSLADEAAMVVDYFPLYVRGNRLFVSKFKPRHLFNQILLFID